MSAGRLRDTGPGAGVSGRMRAGGGQRMGVGEQNGQLLHSFSVCGNNREDASDWIIFGLLIG